MTLDIDVDRFNGAVEEVTEHHHDGMRTLSSDIRDLHSETRRAIGGASRRQLLVRAGLATTALTIGSQVLPLSSLLNPAYGQALTDGDIAAFSASVEFAAVATYEAAVASGKLTPAISAAATEFASHHRAHGGAFAGASGGKATQQPNKTVLTSLSQQLTQARQEMEVVRLAYTLENAAAATYQFALGALQSVEVQQLTASILPVEAGHAAVLGMVLYAGDPTKDPMWLPKFQTEDAKLDPTKNPAT